MEDHDGASPVELVTDQVAWNRADALRRNNIDAIRFLLAASVIFAHSYALTVGDDRTEPLYRLSDGQRTLGGLAVDLFFVLSGFLITHSWASTPQPLVFLRKRILRVYPAFIVASLIGLLIVGPLSSDLGMRAVRELSLPKVAWDIVTLHDVRVPGAFADNPLPGVINGSLWSIRFEFWCYLGVLGLGLIPSIRRHRVLILAIFLTSLAGSLAYEVLGLKLGGGVLGQIVGSPRLWARLLPCFMAGIAFYRYRNRIPWHPLILLGAAVALVLSCLIPYGLTVASPTAGTYVLFSAAFVPWSKAAIVSRYGDFSYGLYVYAFPIQQSVVAILGSKISIGTMFGISFVATLTAAAMSWYLIERPALSRKGARQPHNPPLVVREHLR